MGVHRSAIRLFARWIDDPGACALTFDLIVDFETGRALGPWPIFGATDLHTETRRPFLLDEAGRFDFGAGERAWRTDLRARRLYVGGQFQVWWTAEDVASYEIVKMAALGGKSERLRFSAPPTDQT